MEDFGTIDEEFINSSKTCAGITVQATYEALQCEPGWFLSKGPQCEAQRMNAKFIADFHYLKGNYMEAIQSYNAYINGCSHVSVALRRECIEGISRSYLAQDCYCYALKHAIELQKLSSTFESQTVSLTLLLDCYLGAKLYTEAVTVGQKLVSLHSSSSDLWLKLSCAYAGLYHIPLLFILQHMNYNKCNSKDIKCWAKNLSLDCECSNRNQDKNLYQDNKRSLSIVVTCLLHVDFHLKSVLGSAFGFALKQNSDLQETIKKDIQSLNLDQKYLEAVSVTIKEKYTRVKSDKQCLNEEEFVDRASSKFSSKEQGNYILEELSNQDFEEKWLLILKNTVLEACEFRV